MRIYQLTKELLRNCSLSQYKHINYKYFSSLSLDIYTDGCCRGNQFVEKQNSSAGWGIVIVSNEKSILEINGPVVLNEGSSDYLGAQLATNNIAELTGIGEALLWISNSILTSLPEEMKSDLSNNLLDYEGIVYTDSEYAFKSIMGIYNGSKNRLIIERIRTMYLNLQDSLKVSPLLLRVPINKKDQIIRITNLRFQHVKGHSGNRWNDRADYLANIGSQKTEKSLYLY